MILYKYNIYHQSIFMRFDKEKAFTLRRQGKTYNEIIKRLKIPKSTLSDWFSNNKDLAIVKNQNIDRSRKIWSKNITEYNQKKSKRIGEEWQKVRAKFASEINKLSGYELKLIGVALYWAEGFKKTKYTVTFCNSDPDMIRLIMRFFREICKIEEKKFKAQVQIHPNISESEAKEYWSAVSRISLNDFRKSLSTVSISSKGKRDPHTLPFGTFRIHIHDVRLVNKIKGWMEGVIKKT